MTTPVSDLQSASPSSIIELFVLELNTLQHGTNEIYRFHAGSSLNANGEIVWDGNAYLRFPLEADGFEYTGTGQLPRPKIRISNVLGTITALLLTLPSGLEGAKITRIRTLARYLDAVNFPGNTNPYGAPDPTAEFPVEIYYVDRKTTETRDVIEFELAAAFDLQGIRIPKRQCIANICQWVYRSPECGYNEAAYWTRDDVPTNNSAADVCGKRISSCKLRFESFTRIGSVTSGSNQLVLSNPISIAGGTPVSGFGIPAGTTVSAVSANGLAVTLSQNSTATTTVAKTGTIQSNRTSLVLSNTTALGVGMAVSGPNIPAGTTISSIAGSTVTLSQQADIVLSLFASRSATLGLNKVMNVSTAGLTIGMRVAGRGLPADNSTTITQVYLGSKVLLSYQGTTSSVASTYTFYSAAAYGSETYVFTGNTNYVFRDPATDGLPFGSYPGIGAFS